MSLLDTLRPDAAIFFASVAGMSLYAAFEAPSFESAAVLGALYLANVIVAHVAIRPLEKLWKRREALSLVEGEKK